MPPFINVFGDFLSHILLKKKHKKNIKKHKKHFLGVPNITQETVLFKPPKVVLNLRSDCLLCYVRYPKKMFLLNKTSFWGIKT